MTVPDLPRPTTLAEWIAATIPPGIPALDAAPVGSPRFLFYGRASTHEHQNPRTSRAWHPRPRAAAMLRYIATNANKVDGVVVAEYERAFLDSTSQVRELRAVLERYGVQLWLPAGGGGACGLRQPRARSAAGVTGEALAPGGAAVPAPSRHCHALADRRAGTSPRRQAALRYRLVDVGPHPNRALARRGVRQQRLVPNPATSLIVKRLFTLRLAGHSAAGIAHRRNEQVVPSPSSADAERDRRRVDAGWPLRTVMVILGNPRYTGRQVWHRTSADRAPCRLGWSDRPTRWPSWRRTQRPQRAACMARLHRYRAEPAVAGRHHRTPHR